MASAVLLMMTVLCVIDGGRVSSEDIELLSLLDTNKFDADVVLPEYR